MCTSQPVTAGSAIANPHSPMATNNPMKGARRIRLVGGIRAQD